MKLIMKVQLDTDETENEFNSYINGRYHGNRSQYLSNMKQTVETVLHNRTGERATVTELEIKFEEDTTKRDTKINLCDTCKGNDAPRCWPEDIKFGEGIGNDNVIACCLYEKEDTQCLIKRKSESWKN